MSKKFIFITIFYLVIIIITSPTALVQAAGLDLGINYAAEVGLGEKDPREISANVIEVILGFLGILAVAIILIGGFKWMTAGGNDDQIKEAKKIIVAGIIGLVIILASWGIANFVLGALIDATV